MKNVTISLDEEVFRNARILAAERGTSLSAMVRDYLVGLAADPDDERPQETGVREMPMTYAAQPNHNVAVPANQTALPPGAFGFLADGKPYYTPDGKPRQPGALRGKLGWTEDFDTWPDGFLDAMYGEDTPAADTWWLKANDVLKSSKG